MEYVIGMEIIVRIHTNKQTHDKTFETLSEANEFYKEIMDGL